MKQALCNLGLLLLIIPGPSCNSPSVVGRTSSIGEDAMTRIERVGELPIPEGKHPDGLQFLNEFDGWVSYEGKLWRTSDGGKTWKAIYAPHSAREDYVVYQFANESFGWSATMTRIQQTRDGGYSWLPVSSPIERDKGFVGAVRFLDDSKRGWVAGGIFEPIPQHLRGYGIKPALTNGGEALRAVIFSTDDGGQSWHKQQLNSRIGSMISILEIAENGQGWAISDTDLFRFERGEWRQTDFKRSGCANEELLRTVGLAQPHGDVFGIVDLNFCDTEHGWLSFANGHIGKTTDGGRTWCDVPRLTNIREDPDENTVFGRLYFTGRNSGWGLTRSGKLYQTTDGGSTWIRGEITTKISGIYFLDSTRAWLVSKGGLLRMRL